MMPPSGSAPETWGSASTVDATAIGEAPRTSNICEASAPGVSQYLHKSDLRTSK